MHLASLLKTASGLRGLVWVVTASNGVRIAVDLLTRSFRHPLALPERVARCQRAQSGVHASGTCSTVGWRVSDVRPWSMTQPGENSVLPTLEYLFSLIKRIVALFQF